MKIVGGCLALLICSFSHGQTEVPDINSMSVEEIEKLPPEILMELPFMPTLRKLISKGDMELSEEAVGLMVSVFLRDLYYTPYVEGEDDISRAVAAFQRDLGATTTGEITMGQWEELNRRAIRRHDTPVYAGFNTNVYKVGDWSVNATGTWIIENDKIANPVNTAEIECDKERGTCELIQASIIVPSLESSDNAYNLTLDTQTYKIISWTDNEVISRPYSTDECRSTVLTINTASEEVYEITRNNNQEECKFGDLFELPPLEQPRITRLVEGFDTTFAFWKERRKANQEFMNSRIADRFQKFFEVEK